MPPRDAPAAFGGPAAPRRAAAAAHTACPRRCAWWFRAAPLPFGVASLLYIRARIWHSVDSIELRDRDAQAFARAEQEAMLAASRAVGRMLDCARVGALEGHMVELKSFDEAAFYTAGGGV